MAKVRKVNYDPNSVESGGNFVHHPAPALVRVKCTKADLDFTSSTGNDGVHLEFQIVGSKPAKKGQQWSTLHHYLTFTDAAQWREVEMMEALLGKRVKTYKDTDLVGKVCLAKLRAEEYEGEQQAKISRLMNLDTDEDEDDDEDDDNEPDEEDDDDESDDDEEADDYNEWSLDQLRAELEDRDLETTGRKKALVERLQEADAEGDDDEDDDDDEDEEETVDYESMGIRELRAVAKEAGIATKGLDKDALIEALEEGADEDDDEDEDEDDDDDDETPDYSEWSLKDLRAEAKERGINTRGLDKDALVEALVEDAGDPFADDEE